jgi:hypothetical protein
MFIIPCSVVLAELAYLRFFITLLSPPRLVSQYSAETVKFYLSIYLSIYLFIYLSIYLSIYPLIYVTAYFAT